MYARCGMGRPHATRFLRGLQLTDTQGVAEFTALYPGRRQAPQCASHAPERRQHFPHAEWQRHIVSLARLENGSNAGGFTVTLAVDPEATPAPSVGSVRASIPSRRRRHKRNPPFPAGLLGPQKDHFRLLFG